VPCFDSSADVAAYYLKEISVNVYAGSGECLTDNIIVTTPVEAHAARSSDNSFNRASAFIYTNHNHAVAAWLFI